MDAPKPADPYGSRKHIYHGVIEADGRDVYPPELLAAALKNYVPGDIDGPAAVEPDAPSLVDRRVGSPDAPKPG